MDGINQRGSALVDGIPKVSSSSSAREPGQIDPVPVSKPRPPPLAVASSSTPAASARMPAASSKPTTATASGAAASDAAQQPKKPTSYVIVVPAALGSLITMFNARSFFEQGEFSSLSLCL